MSIEKYQGWEWYYLGEENENVGPFTTEELIEFYSAGAISDESYST